MERGKRSLDTKSLLNTVETMLTGDWFSAAYTEIGSIWIPQILRSLCATLKRLKKIQERCMILHKAVNTDSTHLSVVISVHPVAYL